LFKYCLHGFKSKGHNNPYCGTSKTFRTYSPRYTKYRHNYTAQNNNFQTLPINLKACHAQDYFFYKVDENNRSQLINLVGRGTTILVDAPLKGIMQNGDDAQVEYRLAVKTDADKENWNIRLLSVINSKGQQYQQWVCPSGIDIQQVKISLS